MAHATNVRREIMSKYVRRPVGAAVALGLVVAGAIVASSLPASGQDPATPPLGDPVDVKIGTLTVSLTTSSNPRSGTVVFAPVAERLPGFPTLTQTINTTQPCSTIGFGNIANSPTENDARRLLNVTGQTGTVTSPSPATVQLTQLGLGVNPPNANCGNPAGVIGNNEQMTFDLGNFFTPTSGFEGVYFKSATLQIARRTTSDGQLRVAFGTSTTFATQPTPIVSGNTGTPVTVANGDAGFTSVKLRTTTTSGGNAGLSVVSPTTFEVWAPSDIDFEVDCGEQIVQEGETGDVATNVVFFRGENDLELKDDDDARTCAKVNATVAIVKDTTLAEQGLAPGYVFWNNETEDAAGKTQRVNATFTIEWAPVDPSLANDPTQIDFDGPTGPAEYIDAPWCLSFSEAVNAEGTIYTGVLPPYLVDDPEDTGMQIPGPGANPDGTAPWCVVEREDVTRGNQSFRTEVFYGSGDPSGTRTSLK
jgi:hypothetical protein